MIFESPVFLRWWQDGGSFHFPSFFRSKFPLTNQKAISSSKTPEIMTKAEVAKYLKKSNAERDTIEYIHLQLPIRMNGAQ